MKLRIRRSTTVELSLNEAAILLQALEYASHHFEGWQNACPEWDWPNEVTSLGINKDDVQQCADSFKKVYDAIIETGTTH